MMNCDAIRDELAANPLIDDPAVLAHLDSCTGCEAYRRKHESLDAVLRAELRWEVPAALSASLLALAATAPLALPGTASLPQRATPRGWYITLVYALTALAVAVSLMVGWQVLSTLLLQAGVTDIWAWLWSAPSLAMQELLRLVPQSRLVLSFFMDVRDKLLWLLLAAVLWAAFDKWMPQRPIESVSAQQVQA